MIAVEFVKASFKKLQEANFHEKMKLIRSSFGMVSVMFAVLFTYLLVNAVFEAIPNVIRSLDSSLEETSAE